ncbi:peptidoglycan-binding protein [Streptomyces sp. NBC_00193]|uniref:peptidoglycan-binding protein n=1 Tax=unclassified Streptomyces TaxID=2593676 RepID=UPI002259371D|nr:MULTISPECIES: peptidoglycan-binding protein [unclassified Streptomyces]MCX5123838.1 peptidoglycan-binding protein [Streptomyces sp. NBC_00347]MCX5297083.1 peptidoglycan-binding protein [Streptomyces sp. NBC_00193]
MAQDVGTTTDVARLGLPGSEMAVTAREVAETAPESARGVSGRRRWVVAVALGAVVATLGGMGAALLVKSPAQVAADAAAPRPDVLTATVEHRVLTSSVITRGQVVAGQTVEVIPQVSAGVGAARPVITKIRVRPGDTVQPGQVLMEVSGRPVFVLEGNLPVYRDLSPGATGDDIAQVQKALKALGHSSAPDAAGSFGAGTKAALTSFYKAVGYTPVSANGAEGDPAGEARSQVTAALRALEDARSAQAQASKPGEKPGSGAEGAVRPAGGDGGKAVRRAQEDLAEARKKLAAAEAASGPKLPAAEVVFLQSFPARVDSVAAKVGGEATGTAMTLSAGKLVVQAVVPEYQKDLIQPGRAAEIYSEVTGLSAKGEVTLVSDKRSEAGPSSGQAKPGADAAPAPGGQGATGWLVEITPGAPLKPELTGQDVRVTVTAASTDGKALVVPITAISSGADGRTTVTVLAEGGERRRVEIRAGTAGDGFVAVTPVADGALAGGDRVITGVAREKASP